MPGDQVFMKFIQHQGFLEERENRRASKAKVVEISNMLGVGKRTLERKMTSLGVSVSHKLQGCKKCRYETCFKIRATEVSGGNRKQIRNNKAQQKTRKIGIFEGL